MLPTHEHRYTQLEHRKRTSVTAPAAAAVASLSSLDTGTELRGIDNMVARELIGCLVFLQLADTALIWPI